MINRNTIHFGTQTTGHSVRIDWCFFTNNKTLTVRIFNSVNERSFYTIWSDTTGRNRLGNSTKKNVLKNSLNQREYRKRIIEIWAKSARFNKANQIFPDEARMIFKKGLFSDFVIY